MTLLAHKQEPKLLFPYITFSLCVACQWFAIAEHTQIQRFNCWQFYIIPD